MDRVLALSNRFREEGVDCNIDQYEESPPEGWPKWMDRQIENADFFLVVCTEIYYRRVMGTEEKGKGLGVRWESTLTYQHLYDAGSENIRFIPVLFQPEDVKHIPKPLKGATFYDIDSRQGYEDLYRRITNQPKHLKPKLGKSKTLPHRERKQDFLVPQVFLAKLPTTDQKLFGREEELKWLDEAWEEEHTHILSLVAWGGVGKTALVNEWLSQMEKDNYRGAGRVYGWSFYSQGTREAGHASSDTFFEDALQFFGFEGDPPKSPWDKSKELVKRVRQQPTLFILDGLEPLQYPPGPMHKELHDKGMQALLKDLALFNNGLCVVTTRCELKDIAHTVGKSTKEVCLENLTDEAGARLLSHLGVVGTEDELRVASRDVKGHALALNLLGSYLATVHEGEVRKRDLVPTLYDDEEKGSHARNVMESYETWLKGTLELNILYVMGLFDRPVRGGAIDALREAPAIKGLTDELQNLTKAKWNYAIRHLRELRLLAAKDEHSPDTLDCHPLIREHFAEKLKIKSQQAWQEAHSRLYEYYKNLPEKELPDTLEEMEPLFAAVAHGCQAGKYQETFCDIYWKRISRSGEYYTFNKLGAFGSDLAALSNFFEKPWSKVYIQLKDDVVALSLNIAGFTLRALGRLREAVQSMQAGMEMQAKQKDWKNAAIASGNLSELYLTSSNMPQAVEYARQSVDFADCSGDDFQKESRRTTLADALHQTGELAAALSLFQEAESLQQQSQPEYRYLYSVQGFQFCDLLLSQGKVREVLERAKGALNFMGEEYWLLGKALDHLSLGRAYLLEALRLRSGQALTPPYIPPRGGTKGGVSHQGGKKKGVPLSKRARPELDSGGTAGGFKKAADYLNKAVAGLRESGNQDDIPRGLFARAFLYRMQQDFPNAWDDLAEALEIAERGSMKLWLGDYHLEACRLCLEEGRQETGGGKSEEAEKHLEVGAIHESPLLEQARTHAETADRMINDKKMGYHRRDPEVALCWAGVFLAEGKKTKAREHLKKAKKTLKDKGIRMWDWEVEDLEKRLES